MRFRTKIFLGWVSLTLLVWGGTFVAVRRSVDQSFNAMADASFAGISKGLRNLYLERVGSMHQACQLVVNIPELRALIAEQNYELAIDNQASLQERLDYVNDVVGSTFVFALSKSSLPVAQNEASPWSSLGDLNGFLKHSPAARALVERTFEMDADGQFGIWAYQGRLYQVASVPLVFQYDGQLDAPRPEGALVMGKQLTDALAEELGKSYGSEISFLIGGSVATSSLTPQLKRELFSTYGSRGDSFPAVLELGEESYRATYEPLIDPCSNLAVGTVLIQQNQANAKAFLWKVWRNLAATIAVGIVAAGFASFFLSLAISRPVGALVASVRGVAQGDLDVKCDASGRDELAELAGAFNDMVSRIRQSRDEQERLLHEARKAAQREHLLHEVAQQINQRLDVQSSLAMFLNSVKNLCPDVQLDVFRYDGERGELEPLRSNESGTAGGQTPDNRRPGAGEFNSTETLDRLVRHELVYLCHWSPPAAADGSFPPSETSRSTCLVPMRAEERLLGAISATRNRPDGFTTDERDFLQALADHFAIALANAQVYEELQQAYHDLRMNQQQTIQTERLRALGQMASGIAHDFNNHLTGVLAFLELSLDRDNLDEELRGWLEMSRESSQAAAEVVKLLRNFYRRETSNKLEPVDLNELVTATVSLTRPRWFDMPRQHGLMVHVKEELSDVGCVLGTASELRDALTNLLFNSVDAMPQGGEITVRTRREGEEIVLEVHDAGIGMTDEVRARCLDPFFTTKGTQGTGLGLSMIHGIVERHHGRLAIESEPGRGTTIAITLARAEAHHASPVQQVPERRTRRRILCVDDDLRILKSLEGMLRNLGHQVTTTASGAEAIDEVASGRFDLLITDLGMPNVDGREVARSAKSLAPRTRVLMFTGWADRMTMEGDLPEGVDEIIGKPISKDQLQQAISRCAPTTANTPIAIHLESGPEARPVEWNG